MLLGSGGQQISQVKHTRTRPSLTRNEARCRPSATDVRSHLLKNQRPEQSGFTSGKLTTDRILALRVLMERHREFGQGMLAAYVYLKKAFNSLHRKALWDLLRLHWSPAGTIGLLYSLYSGTESAVKCGWGECPVSFLCIRELVKQGCVFAPLLFN